MSKRIDLNRNESWRGSVENNTEPRFLVIGQIGKAHGVRGEVRVVTHTDIPERFAWLEAVYVGDKAPTLVPVESVRFHKNWVLLKLEGYDDRDQVAVLRGQLLQIEQSQAIPLEEGEYFLFQLDGLSVTTDDGQYLGSITGVIETGANNVFVVNGPDGEILLPDIEEVVVDIDFDERQMIVHILPGLLST